MLRETGWRWPEGPPKVVRSSRQEVREAIVREARRRGKSIEETEWDMQSLVKAAKLRYFTWEEVGRDTMNWHDAEPREGTPESEIKKRE